MGASEIKTRLLKADIPLERWNKVEFIERSPVFHDLVLPDGCGVSPLNAWIIRNVSGGMIHREPCFTVIRLTWMLVFKGIRAACWIMRT